MKNKHSLYYDGDISVNLNNVNLVLIRGLPGSGKSTLARRLEELDGSTHLETDMYFVDKRGKYRFKPKLLTKAHQWCKREVRNALMQNQRVVVSNTFVQQWELAPYYMLAEELRKSVVVIECQGDFGNVHGVEQSTVESMKKRWESVPDVLTVCGFRNQPLSL